MPQYVVFLNKDNIDQSFLDALGPARMGSAFRAAAVEAREKGLAPAVAAFSQELDARGLTDKVERIVGGGKAIAAIVILTDEKTAKEISSFSSVSSIVGGDTPVLQTPQPRKAL